MSTVPVPTPATQESFLQKVWTWIVGKTQVVETDLAAILGSKAASDLEAVGKALLTSWVGPLATSALADATDVASGQMSISKAITSLISSAEASGKSLSGAAALQVIALAQNSLPVSTPDSTVTPTP